MRAVVAPEERKSPNWTSSSSSAPKYGDKDRSVPDVTSGRALHATGTSLGPLRTPPLAGIAVDLGPLEAPAKAAFRLRAAPLHAARRILACDVRVALAEAGSRALRHRLAAARELALARAAQVATGSDHAESLRAARALLSSPCHGTCSFLQG